MSRQARYPSDTNDEKWAVIEPLLPAHDPMLALRRVLSHPGWIRAWSRAPRCGPLRHRATPRRADRPAALELAELIDGLVGR